MSFLCSLLWSLSPRLRSTMTPSTYSQSASGKLVLRYSSTEISFVCARTPLSLRRELLREHRPEDLEKVVVVVGPGLQTGGDLDDFRFGREIAFPGYEHPLRARNELIVVSVGFHETRRVVV